MLMFQAWHNLELVASNFSTVIKNFIQLKSILLIRAADDKNGNYIPIK